MSKIERLTPAQERRILEFRQEWLEVGLSTAPADRPAVEAAISAMYGEIGKPPPRFLWFASPASCLLAYGFLKTFDFEPKVELRGQLRGQLGDQLGDQLWGQLWDQLGGQLWDQLWDQLGRAFWGQHDAYWIAWYLFPALELSGFRYDAVSRRRLDLWATVARSCGWWWPYEGWCIVSDRPDRVRLEPAGRRSTPNGLEIQRLHSGDGPALGFRDGYGVWAWHGVRVPRKVIEQPEALTVEEVLGERNAEVRRVMIERLDAARLMAMAQPEVVHEDRDQLGQPRRLLRIALPDDEPIVVVAVTNSTPEPDGSLKNYMLRVPPGMRTCGEAVAWTFGMSASEYAPAQES